MGIGTERSESSAVGFGEGGKKETRKEKLLRFLGLRRGQKRVTCFMSPLL